MVWVGLFIVIVASIVYVCAVKFDLGGPRGGNPS